MGSINKNKSNSSNDSDIENVDPFESQKLPRVKKKPKVDVKIDLGPVFEELGYEIENSSKTKTLDPYSFSQSGLKIAASALSSNDKRSETENKNSKDESI